MAGERYLLCLVVASGPRAGQVLQPSLPYTIGRDPQCHLRPASDLVSARHCLIRDSRDGPVLLDLDNGTFVNGVRIRKEVLLTDNDELRIGPLHFRVQLELAVVDAEFDLSLDPEDEAAAAMLLEVEPDDELPTPDTLVAAGDTQPLGVAPPPAPVELPADNAHRANDLLQRLLAANPKKKKEK